MDISLDSIKKPLINLLKRYHIILFVVLVIGGLGAAVLLLNNTISKSGQDSGYVSNANSTGFDKDTIERVNQLKSRDQNNNTINFDKGRTNPFVE